MFMRALLMQAAPIRALGAALVLSLVAVGCASNKKDEIEFIARDVDTLYNLAADLMDKRQFRQAALVFDEVERQHPFSSWARRAQLMSAFANYRAREYEEAIQSAQRFLALHPGNKDAPYAYYIVAMSHYEQITDVRRDQKTTERAFNAMNEVIRRFPNSDYAADARLKVDFVRDHLAGKDMEIGRYYQKQGNFLAAVIRFRTVVERYDTTTHTPEALHRLTECYLALGMRVEAQRAAAVLGHNYPGSKWYERAFTMVNKVERS
jgi:outer membrane protein assembly factor BamD